MRRTTRLISMLLVSAIGISMLSPALAAEAFPQEEPQGYTEEVPESESPAPAEPEVSEPDEPGVPETANPEAGEETEPATPLALAEPAAFVAGDTITLGSYTAKVNEDGTSVTLTGISSALAEELVLPEALGGLTVTALGSWLFSGPGGYSMKTIVIPKGVTNIDPTALNHFHANTVTAYQVAQGNTAYEAVDGVLFRTDGEKTLVAYPQARAGSAYTVPGDVKAIGKLGFYMAKVLTTVTLPEHLVSIGDSAFASSGLTGLRFPPTLTSIGSGIFESCNDFSEITLAMEVIPEKLFRMSKGLTRLTLENTVKEIGAEAFYLCENLTEVDIPGSVTDIGRAAFGSCGKLSRVALHEGLPEIGPRVFADCDALQTITLPASLTAIRDGAFSSAGLTSLTIPPNVTTIESNAFNGNAFTELTIPNTVTTMGMGVFAYNKNLVKATVEEGALTLGDSVFSNCTALTDVILPNSLKVIGSGAFGSCTSLSSITLPTGLTTLGDTAFKSCPLKTVILPDSVERIGSMAFQYCRQLTSIQLSASLTSIGSWAFEQCTALQRITIPASVREIGLNAFTWCSALLEVVFAGNAPAATSNPFHSNTGMTFYRTAGTTGFDQAPWAGLNWKVGPVVELEKKSIQIELTSSLSHSRQDELILWLTVDITPRTYDGEANPIAPNGLVTTFIQVQDGDAGALPDAVYYQGGNSSTFRTFGYNVEKYQGKTIRVYVTMDESIGFEAGASNTLEGLVLNLKDLAWDEDRPFGGPNGAQGFENEVFVTEDGPKGGLIITALDARSATAEAVVLPAEIGGKAVTALGEGLFQNCVNLKSVTIPATVASLGADCFKGCINLGSVTLEGDAPALSGAGQPFLAGVEVHIQPAAKGYDTAPWTEMDLWYPLVATTLSAGTPTMTPGGNKLALTMKAALGPDNYYGDSGRTPKLSELKVSMDAYAVTNLSIDADGTLRFEAPWFLSGKEVTLTVKYQGDGRYFLAATPVQGKLQLPAFYVKPDEGGSSGGGSGGGSSGGAATPDKKAEAAETKVTVNAKDVDAAVKAAEKGEAVVLKADAPKDSKTVAVTVPAKLLKTVADSEAGAVTLQTPVADIALDAKVLETIQGDGKQDVVVSAGAADVAALPAAAQEVLTDRPVYDISITSGGKAVSQFGGGTVKVALPYTPAQGEDAESLVVCWVKEDGTTQVMPNSVWKDGKVTFATPHLSTYAILSLDSSFADTEAHWAKADICFSASRGIVVGMGGDQFAPDAQVTGAMAVTVLGRMAGVADAAAPEDWASPHLAWAKEQGYLPQGFDAGAPLPREQLAVLLARYMGGGRADTRLASYTDQAEISGGCLDSVQLVQQLGLMKGRDDGSFDPQGTLTRAELAAVLHRMVELKLG